MKKKFIGILSCILTFAIMLCSLPLYVFAEETQTGTYSITYGSPAIPMYEMKQTDLSKVTVQFESGGEAISGSDIDWTVSDNATGIEISESKILKAYTAGTYRIFANYGGTKITLYVIVNKTDRSDWTLYESDFTTGDTSDFDGWSVYTKKYTNNNTNWIKSDGLPNDFDIIKNIGDGRMKYTGGESGLALTQNSGTDLRYGSIGALVLENDIVKDFSDYKISASIFGRSAFNYEDIGFGVFGRGILSGDESTGTTLTFNSLVYNHNPSKNIAKVCNSINKDNATSPLLISEYKYISASPIDLEYVFSGNTVSFSANSNTVLENTENNIGDKGVVGVFSALYEDAYYAVLKSIKISLVNTEMPVQEDISLYNVKKESPAIPMNSFTYVNTADLLISIGEDSVNGSLVSFEPADNFNGVVYDGLEKTFTAYRKGIYKFIARYGESETPVYVCVKDKDDTNWVLYETDFSDEAEAKEHWTASFYNNASINGKFNATGNFIDKIRANGGTYVNFEGYYPYAMYEYQTGKYAVDHNGITENLNWSTSAYFYCTDEIFNDFSDYTLDTTYQSTTSYHLGHNVMGRAVLDSDGVRYTSGAGISIRNNFGNDDKGYIKLYDNELKSDNLTDITGSAASFPRKGNNSNVYTIKVKSKYAGTSMSTTVSVPQDNYSQSFETTVSETGNGTVGFWISILCETTGMSQIQSYNKVSVYLNNDPSNPSDYPAYHEDTSLFVINDSSPAIPMYKMKSVDLNTVAIEFADSTVLGEFVNWTVSDNASGIEITGSKILKAYKTGTYKIIADYGGEQKTVYVMVNEIGNTDFVLYESDFTAGDASDFDGWSVYTKKSTKNDTNWIKSDGLPNDFDIIKNIGDGRMKYTGGESGLALTQNSGTDLPFGSIGALVLENDIVKDFSDYKISASIFGRSSFHYDNIGFGVFGRGILSGDESTGTTLTFNSLVYNHNPSKNIAKVCNSINKDNATSTPLISEYKYISASPIDLEYVFSGNTVSFSANSNTVLENTENNIGDKGVVGVFSALYEDAYYAVLRSIRISLNVTNMPEFSDIVYGNTLYVRKYSVLDFKNYVFNIDSDAVSGNDLSFFGVESSEKFEFIKTDKTACVFDYGTYTLNANYSGKTTTITVICTDDTSVDYTFSNKLLTTTGNGSAEITRIETGKYKVTLYPENNYKTELLSLKSGGKSVLNPYDKTGRVYMLNVDNASKLDLSVNFVPDDNGYDTKWLGSTLNYVKSGIKFGFRTSNIKKSQTNDKTGVLNSTININGTQYTVKGMGILLIPGALINQNEELTVETPNAINNPLKKLINATEAFSDAAVTLANIPSSRYDVDISARTYIKYDDNGTDKYVYGETISRSYNSVNESLVKNIEASALNITAKTTNELDSDDSTTNTSYTSSDTVTFSIETKYGNTPISNVNLKWECYRLDGSGQNIISRTEGIGCSAANEPLKVNVTPDAADNGGRFVLLKIKSYNSDNAPYLNSKTIYCYAIVNSNKIENQGIVTADYQAALEEIKNMFINASSQKKMFPEPDKERSEWLSLNGKWEFSFNSPTYDKTIEVPYSWTSPLSTIDKETSKGQTSGFYRMTSEWNPSGDRIFLVFGAIDYTCNVKVNGEPIGSHCGGYDKFEFDVTNVWKRNGINIIEVEVEDLGKGNQLTGKQYYGSCAGIWQSARLESRSNAYIDNFFVKTDMQGNVSLEINATNAEGATVSFKNCKLGLFDDIISDSNINTSATVINGKATLNFRVNNPYLWSPDTPYLYYGDLVLSFDNQEDKISTYIGIREIGAAKFDGNSIKYITINGKPCYINGVLDQSYNPSGYFTLPSDADCKDEIQRLKDIGINMSRIHIKAEEPLKLYYADKLGVLIMEDIPCFWDSPTQKAMEQYEKEMEAEIIRDRNHPSIFYWVLFNESWGLNTSTTDSEGNTTSSYLKQTQDWVVDCYNKAKALDPTRLIEDNSTNSEHHTVTDVNTWHFYSNGYENVKKVVSNFCNNAYVGTKSNYTGGYTMGDVPCMNSECGNVWGVSGTTGESDISWQYKYMLNEFRLQDKLCGFVVTQFHDVTNEWNGFYTIDNNLKDYGYEKYGSSLKDLHSQDYVGADYEPMKAVSPGTTVDIPMFVSSFTDERHNKDLTLKFNFKLESAIDGDTDYAVSIPDMQVAISEYGCTKLGNVSFTIPQHDGVAALCWSLYDGEEKVMSNYLLFDVTSTRSDVLTVDVNDLTADGFVSEKVEGSHVIKAINKGSTGDYQKISGIGAGSFGTTVNLSDIPGYTANSGIRLMFEASTRRPMAHDYPDNIAPDGGEQDYVRGYTVDPGTNPNSFKQTSGKKYTGTLKILLNGTEIGTVTLKDCPADSRGSLSHYYQPTTKLLDEAGSYGQLVDISISSETISSLVGDSGSFNLTLQATENSGLSIYDRYAGQYGIGLTLMAE